MPNGERAANVPGALYLDGPPLFPFLLGEFAGHLHGWRLSSVRRMLGAVRLKRWRIAPKIIVLLALFCGVVG